MCLTQQLAPIGEVVGWKIDQSAKLQIDVILANAIKEPVGPKFMAPSAQMSA